MVKFTVIGSNTSKDLARRIARRLRATYIETQTKIFPDGESKITFGRIPKNNIILVVQSTYPPVDTNLLQILAIISQARKTCSRIYAIIPYMGYARQDKQFLSGEVVTMSIVAKMLEAAGARKIFVVDIHSKTALNHFKIPTENISAVPELAKYFKRMKLKNMLVVSPDIRDLVVVDDIISTGGSIVKATQFLKKQKCKRVFVACTHGLFIGDAERKIKKAGVSQIISSNTIPKSTSKIDVSGVIARSIQ